jgi:hypothetical protein
VKARGWDCHLSDQGPLAIAATRITNLQSPRSWHSYNLKVFSSVQPLLGDVESFLNNQAARRRDEARNLFGWGAINC